jgi:hypothetical protein
MGLDNGIHLKTKNKIDLNDWEITPDYVKIEFDEFSTKEYNDGYYYDICYWRKCWNIRHIILNIVGKENDGGIYEIDKPSQIQNIINEIIILLENMEEWEQSIWTAKEMIPHLAQDIVNLSWLKKYKVEHPEAKIIFYDSY